MPTTALDVIRDAFLELGSLNAADVLSQEDSALGLNKFNRILDNWNAQRAAVYTEAQTTFTLTPLLTTHTIGPTGATITVTQRPVAIRDANLVDTTVTPNVSIPLTIRSLEWRMGLSFPSLTGPQPTDLVYDPTWPNGSLFFFPIPTLALNVTMLSAVLLTAVTLTTTFSMPPGYQDAITLTLAEDLAGPLRIGVPPITRERAREARARIFALNDEPRAISTRDAGMPGSVAGAGFDYRRGY